MRSRARREQTGIDGAALAGAFEPLTDPDVEAVARRWAAQPVVAVVGAPRPRAPSERDGP